MSRALDMFISGLLLLLGVVFFAMTFGDDFDVFTFGGDVGPAYAPRLFLVPWIIFATIAMVQATRNTSIASGPGRIDIGQMSSAVVIVLVSAYGITKIGFVFAMIPGMFLLCLAIGYRNIVMLTLVVIVTIPAIWALFTFGFEMILPRSPWFNRI